MSPTPTTHMNIHLSIRILFMYTVNRQLPKDVFYKPQAHTHTHIQTPCTSTIMHNLLTNLRWPAEKPKPSRYIKRPVETPISEIAGTTTPSWTRMVRRCRIFTCESMSTYYVYGPLIYKTACCAHLMCINWYDMDLIAFIIYLACMSTAYNANTACFPTSVELRDPCNAILHHAMQCSASGRPMHVHCRQA